MRMNPMKILNTIKKHKTFLISTHVNPDPDALASQLAMARYLKSLGKRVHVVNEDHIPQRLKFLPGAGWIKKVKKGQRLKFDVAIIVDCGDYDRIGEVKNCIPPDKILINIDHHVTNDLFGDLNMVVPKASSTSEVVFDFFTYAGFSLTRNMAILLYLGIMTDTGSFRYENTTAHTHLVVARLMQFNLSVNRLYTKIYETIPLNDLKYFTKVASTFDTLYGGRVICLELKKDMMKKFSEEFDLRDKIFRYLRAIKGVEVLVILTEQKKNKTRVNLRSQRRVNVAKLASRFNGGGHNRASGCHVDGDIKNARQKILAAIRKVL